MGLIQKIKRVKQIGVFDGFAWGAGVDDFKHYNLIYGLNGSGKTTLSNILRCLELGLCIEGEITLTIDGKDLILPSAIGQSGLPQVKVFNRDFVNDAVFTETSTARPIYFLGEDSAAKRKQIEELQNQIAGFATQQENATAKGNRDKETLETTRIQNASTIKELLRSSGNNRYNNYDKRSFSAKCETFKQAKTKPKALTIAEKNKLKAIAGGTPKPVLAEHSLSVLDLHDMKDRVAAILSQSVVSNVIDTLKSNPSVNTWVQGGMKLHRQPGSESWNKICHFCEGVLSDKRLSALEQHFSDQYAQVLSTITALRNEIRQRRSALEKFELLDEARLYDELVDAYRASCEAVVKGKTSVVDFLNQCDITLAKKEQNPFETFTFTEAVPSAVDLHPVNKQVQAHNARTADFDGEIAKARSALEESAVAVVYDNVIALETKISDAGAELRRLNETTLGLQQKIQQLDREIREHRRPAEEINADLASYLGRNDITLAVEDSGYKVLRGGKPAAKLSEGERTALSLIYFLKSLEDRAFDRANGVVVIDDPVSSLDANALFYAASFIQERTKDAGQLFISTHNFGYLKLVRKWFNRANQPRQVRTTGRGANMYMLICSTDALGRRASLVQLDPLLVEYESEYHYLFAQIHKGSKAAAGTIENFYHHPNVARRVLEAFLAFRIPLSGRAGEGDLHKNLMSLGFDAAKTNRIVNFLNAHSHNVRPDDAIEHDTSILLETPSILQDVLALMRHADNRHVTEMTTLVS